MSDIIQQLTAQLGIGAGQAEAGAGAVMKLIGSGASEGDFKQLLGALPEASHWMAKAAGTDEQGGGLAALAGGLFGGSGGGSLGKVVAMLASSGLPADKAARFLTLLLTLVKGKVGHALMGRLASSVPFMKDGMGAATGGGVFSALGKLIH